MRKYILSILSIFLLSCNQLRYQDKFDAYADSEHAAFYQWNLYKNSDTLKANCFSRLGRAYGDSMDVYYKLMYPNGNPATRVTYNDVKLNCCNSEK